MAFRAQTSTEYLVLLSMVLVISGIVVVLVSGLGASESSSQKSQLYWASSTPLSVKVAKIMDGALVLEVENAGDEPITITALKIGNASKPLFAWADGIGASYCTYPDGVQTCVLPSIDVGRTLAFAATGFGSYCSRDSARFEVGEVHFSYNYTLIGGFDQYGSEPLSGFCTISSQAGPSEANYESGCGVLSEAGKTYYLSDNVVVAAADHYCFNVTASGVTIDCQSMTVFGGGERGSTAIFSSAANTVVRNCNIVNFSCAVNVSGGAGANVSGNTIFPSVPESGHESDWVGIYLASSSGAIAGYNSVLSSHNATGLRLEGCGGAVVRSNSVTTAGGFGVFESSCANSSFYFNTFAATGGTAAELRSASYGTFERDKLSCSAEPCTAISLSGSSGATFNNVYYNRSRANLNSGMGTNNLTLNWYVNFYVFDHASAAYATWAVPINLTNITVLLLGTRTTNLTGAVAGWIVQEATSFSGSTTNSTPHNFTLLNADYSFNGSSVHNVIGPSCLLSNLTMVGLFRS